MTLPSPTAAPSRPPRRFAIPTPHPTSTMIGLTIPPDLLPPSTAVDTTNLNTGIPSLSRSPPTVAIPIRKKEEAITMVSGAASAPIPGLVMASKSMVVEAISTDLATAEGGPNAMSTRGMDRDMAVGMAKISLSPMDTGTSTKGVVSTDLVVATGTAVNNMGMGRIQAMRGHTVEKRRPEGTIGRADMILTEAKDMAALAMLILRMIQAKVEAKDMPALAMLILHMIQAKVEAKDMAALAMLILRLIQANVENMDVITLVVMTMTRKESIIISTTIAGMMTSEQFMISLLVLVSPTTLLVK